MKEYIVRIEHGADGAVHYFRTGGEIVRCEDCKWWVPARCTGEPKTGICEIKCAWERSDDYCSHVWRKAAESE